MPSPIQTFKDNIRPANLMLRYIRYWIPMIISVLKEMINALRAIVQAEAPKNYCWYITNCFWVWFASVPSCHLPRYVGLRNHLLRQAVVAGCTALDTYLPSLFVSIYHVDLCIW